MAPKTRHLLILSASSWPSIHRWRRKLVSLRVRYALCWFFRMRTDRPRFLVETADGLANVPIPTPFAWRIVGKVVWRDAAAKSDSPDDRGLTRPLAKFFGKQTAKVFELARAFAFNVINDSPRNVDIVFHHFHGHRRESVGE